MTLDPKKVHACAKLDENLLKQCPYIKLVKQWNSVMHPATAVTGLDIETRKEIASANDFQRICLGQWTCIPEHIVWLYKRHLSARGWKIKQPIICQSVSCVTTANMYVTKGYLSGQIPALLTEWETLKKWATAILHSVMCVIHQGWHVLFPVPQETLHSVYYTLFTVVFKVCDVSATTCTITLTTQNKVCSLKQWITKYTNILHLHISLRYLHLYK